MKTISNFSLVLLFLSNSICFAEDVSYYADSLIDKKMANGKPFNQSEMICAADKYTLGTMLKISYNGRSAEVLVSDRPGDKTDIDLSKFAFEKLAPLHYGKLRDAKVEIIGTK
jgi:rare lipoprotein A (peptidoglycan hydrolase)